MENDPEDVTGVGSHNQEIVYNSSSERKTTDKRDKNDYGAKNLPCGIDNDISCHKLDC